MSSAIDESKARMEATQAGDAGLSSEQRQVAELEAPSQESKGVNVKQAKEILGDFESRLNE